MKHFYLLFLLVAFISCKNDEGIEQITNPEDYNSFLSSSNKKSFTRALSEIEFWSKRLRADSSGVGDLGPLANAYTLLFETTGEVSYLLSAEIILQKANSVAASNKDFYTRSLAQNYITQHRFKEARYILEKSFKGISNKRATQLLLFDVYLELGEYNNANIVLGKLKNTNDYNYLIRLAKWNDHNGNLDAAIRNLEAAKKIAESRKSSILQIWTYTNLADYYGHAGRINESYELYIKTLQLQADHVYAKKQIAWIVYSYEKNTKETIRILDSIMINYNAPNYSLFKAEVLDYSGATSEANNLKKKFITVVEDNNYGDMYNSYLIEYYSEINPKKALEIAEKEITNRATPEIYALLAFAQFKVGDKEKALHTITNFVAGKTFDPKALYFSQLIYNVTNEKEKVSILASYLKEASFELGPLLFEKIN